MQCFHQQRQAICDREKPELRGRRRIIGYGKLFKCAEAPAVVRSPQRSSPPHLKNIFAVHTRERNSPNFPGCKGEKTQEQSCFVYHLEGRLERNSDLAKHILCARRAVMLSIKRGLHGWLGRVARLSNQRARGIYTAPPKRGSRVSSSSTSSAFLQHNEIIIGGRHQNFGDCQVLLFRRFIAGSAQLGALDIPEEAEWDRKTIFLLSLGLSKDQALRVLKQCPLLLQMSLGEELEPKVSFLKGLGVMNLAKVIVISPNLLVCRIEMTLMPKVAFFESFGIQRQSIGKIIERFPTVLTYSVEGNMMSKTKFLESIGLERENIAKVIMRSPYIFALSIEDNMRPKVELLESIGVDKRFMSKLITRCPKIFCLSNEENVIPKIKYLESVGVQKASMGKIVGHCPSILNLSTSHIQKKLDFLQANNFSVNRIVNKCPVYLTYSLEQRIKPSLKMISSLKDLGLLRKDYSLSYILQISQRQFLRDFAQSHPHGASFYSGS